jgi:hypothetical protein
MIAAKSGGRLVDRSNDPDLADQRGRIIEPANIQPE